MSKPSRAKITAILFDAVGTLIYPHPSVTEAYHAVGSRFGSQLTHQDIATRFPSAFARSATADAEPTQGETNEPRERLRWQNIVAEVFCELPQARGELFKSLWDHFAQSCHWRLFEDVSEAWNNLTAAGFRLGIASNFDERLFNICRDLAPLSECSSRLYVSSRIGFPKPHSEFYRRIERELQIPSDQILLVGDDQTNDYVGADAAGWQALLLDRKQQLHGPDVIHSLSEVIFRI